MCASWDCRGRSPESSKIHIFCSKEFIEIEKTLEKQKEEQLELGISRIQQIKDEEKQGYLSMIDHIVAQSKNVTKKSFFKS